MIGLKGKVCSTCQQNVVNIRTGKVYTARRYFENINIVSEDAKGYINQQYEQYASAAVEQEQNGIEEKIKEEEELSVRIENLLLSTTSSLDGYEVVKYIDIVHAEAIYKLSFAKALSSKINDAVDSLSVFTNRDLSGTTALISEAKDYVKNEIKKKAAKLGANAIIGIDIESSVNGDGMARVSINGTAVIIEKK